MLHSTIVALEPDLNHTINASENVEVNLGNSPRGVKKERVHPQRIHQFGPTENLPLPLFKHGACTSQSNGTTAHTVYVDHYPGSITLLGLKLQLHRPADGLGAQGKITSNLLVQLPRSHLLAGRNLLNDLYHESRGTFRLVFCDLGHSIN